MLTLDPARRISAEEALRHPYLTDYHRPESEPIAAGPFNFDYERHNLAVEDIKSASWRRLFRGLLPVVAVLHCGSDGD